MSPTIAALLAASLAYGGNAPGMSRDRVFLSTTVAGSEATYFLEFHASEECERLDRIDLEFPAGAAVQARVRSVAIRGPEGESAFRVLRRNPDTLTIDLRSSHRVCPLASVRVEVVGMLNPPAGEHSVHVVARDRHGDDQGSFDLPFSTIEAKGSQGDPGPEGPIGPPGPAGPQGPSGVGRSQSCARGRVSGIDADGTLICSPDVRFLARRNAVYTWPDTGSDRVVPFDQEVYDTANAFDPATGTFTAPVSGLYTFHATLHMQGFVSGALVYGYIAAADYNHMGTGHYSTSTGWDQIHMSATVYLQAGQRASVHGYIGSNPPGQLYGNTAFAYMWTYFEGALVD